MRGMMSYRRHLTAFLSSALALVLLSACSSREDTPETADLMSSRTAIVTENTMSDALMFIASGGAGQARIYDEQFDGWVNIAILDRYTAASGRTCARFQAIPDAPHSLNGGTWYACQSHTGWYLVDIR